MNKKTKAKNLVRVEIARFIKFDDVASREAAAACSKYCIATMRDAEFTEAEIERFVNQELGKAMAKAMSH